MVINLLRYLRKEVVKKNLATFFVNEHTRKHTKRLEKLSCN